MISSVSFCHNDPLAREKHNPLITYFFHLYCLARKKTVEDGVTISSHLTARALIVLSNDAWILEVEVLLWEIFCDI